MPSVTDIIFLALLGVLLFTFLSVKLLGDAGIGWHLRTGQIILQRHSVPRVDPFSSTMQGKPWVAWEWLYDLIVGELDRAAGLNGVVWFTAVIIGVTFAGAFRFLIRTGTNLWLTLGLVLLAASASMVHFLARPHVLSWLFTLIWFWILESTNASYRSRDHRGSSRLLWLLPLLMIVWVNVHGGFLIGFALLGIFLIDGAWRWVTDQEGQPFRRLLLVSVACGVATLINPYGPRLLAHVYGYLSNRFLMNHIQEFQSPDFHGAAQKCFAALILISVLALAVRARSVGVKEFLLIAFAIYSGLYATRNIPVSSLLLIFVAGPMLCEAVRKRWRRTSLLPDRHASFFLRMNRLEANAKGNLWSIAGALVSLGIVLGGGASLVHAQFSPRRFPVQAVNYVAEHDLPGPILGPDYWGGYFIYRLYPKDLVGLDDRHDLYGDSRLKNYLKFLHAEPGWEEFLESSHAGSVIVPANSAMATEMNYAPGWKMVYRDEVAVVLVRAGS